MSDGVEMRPKEGYWVIQYWEASPCPVFLRGDFTADELRWLANHLDQYNSASSGAEETP